MSSSRTQSPDAALRLPIEESPLVAMAALGALLGGEVLAAVLVTVDHPLVHVACGLLALLVLLVAGRATSGWLTVGVDGLVVQRTALHRFVPHGEVASLAIEGAPGPCALRIHLRSSEELCIPMASARAAEAAGAALRRHATGAASPASRDSVCRELLPGSGSGAQWLARLRAVAQGLGEHYRRAPMSLEALRSLAREAGTSGAVRAAAAVVLDATTAGSHTRAQDRHRRTLAAAVAQPRLRIALDQLTEATEDAQLAAALELIASHERVAAERVEARGRLRLSRRAW